MFGFLKKLFGTKPTVSPCPEAPYKVEKPESIKQEAPKVEAASKKKPATKNSAAPKQGGSKKPRKPKSKA